MEIESVSLEDIELGIHFANDTLEKIEKLLEKSRYLLFNSASDLKEEISKLSKTIYCVKEKGNVKNKIISDCVKIIQNG